MNNLATKDSVKENVNNELASLNLAKKNVEVDDVGPAKKIAEELEKEKVRKEQEKVILTSFKVLDPLTAPGWAMQ